MMSLVAARVGRHLRAGWPGRQRLRQAVHEGLEAGREALVAVVQLDVLAEGDQGGKRSAGRERKNSCSCSLVATSRTRCSLTEVRGLLTAKPTV